MKQTRKRQFEVYAPGSKDRAPRLIQTIEVEVETRSGHEFLTEESRRKIEEIRRQDRGLMSGAEIKAMRQRLQLSQSELTELLQCGDKSLSRWENGHGFPTGIVNTFLRLLDSGTLSPDTLRGISLGPINQRESLKATTAPEWKCIRHPAGNSRTGSHTSTPTRRGEVANSWINTEIRIANRTQKSIKRKACMHSPAHTNQFVWLINYSLESHEEHPHELCSLPNEAIMSA